MSDTPSPGSVVDESPEEYASPAPETTVEDVEEEFVADRPDGDAATTLDEGYQTGPGLAAPLSPASDKDANAEDKKQLPAVEGLALGPGVKKLMETINHLRTLGVEDIVAPLPKVVVVGDQSAGKSSLIEAISEIKVPRNAGTCTRCPLEINLKTDDTWNCKVSLRQKYVFYPTQALEKGPAPKKTPGRSGVTTKQRATSGRSSASIRSFGQPPCLYENFIAQDAKDYEFIEVEDPGKLEEALAWAQLATLHPNEDYRNYIPDDDGNTSAQLTKPELKFSPNIVRLDITGPRLPNLSFYDLPGVINRSEDMHETHLVATVRNLVNDYIEKDNSLILLAQSMNNDPNVSSAAQLVEEMGEDTKKRCIGVLTKPDLIGHKKTFPLWKKVLDNSTFSLGHKYFVTKQPDQDSLEDNITHADAREQEKDFFETKEPWATEFAEFSERFGTERLQTALSEKLTFQILNSLDEIEEKVRQKAEEVESELLGLPDPPSDNLRILLDRALEKFNQHVQRSLNGGSPELIFQFAWNRLAKQFGAAITGTMPSITGTVMTKSSAKAPETPQNKKSSGNNVHNTPGTPTPRGTARSEPISLDASDEDNPAPASQPSTRKRGTAQTTDSPVKKQKVAPSIQDGPFKTTYGLAKRFTVMELRNRISRYCSNAMSNLINPEAIFELCHLSILHWEQILRIFLDLTASMIRQEIFDRLQDVFDVYKQTGLYGELVAAIDGLLSEASDQMRDSVGALYQGEVFKPAILDDEALEHTSREFAISLKRARRDQRVNLYLDKQEKQTGKPTVDQERINKAARVTDDQLGVDPFTKEVEVMAQVQAYYKLAKTRFVESVFLNVQAHTFGRIRNVLLPTLERGLGLMLPDAVERCQRLMVEDPQREIRRAELKKNKTKLNEALKCLTRLHMPKSTSELYSST
ncbi:MAG: hypothetical protein M1816_004495 [Peltula sp. TS41687]|nr:MAG: hypothetical protein M1816_004495 [Peltula sp. TS41687]